MNKLLFLNKRTNNIEVVIKEKVRFLIVTSDMKSHFFVPKKLTKFNKFPCGRLYSKRKNYSQQFYYLLKLWQCVFIPVFRFFLRFKVTEA
jgi:hypothetical protein